MIKVLYKIQLYICLSLIFVEYVSAQQIVDRGEIADMIQHLQSQEWRKRESAARYLCELSESLKTDEVKLALIKELETETQRIASGDFERCLECDDGGEQGYQSYLYTCVIKMKDPRAFEFFAQHNMFAALLEYGEKGVETIIKKYNGLSINEKQFVVGELVRLQDKFKKFKKENREKLMEIFLGAIEEFKQPNKREKYYDIRQMEYANVRIFAIRGLSQFAQEGDGQAINAIKKLAKTDTYSKDFSKKKFQPGINKPYSGPKIRYPVREEAQKALEKLKKEGKIKE